MANLKPENVKRFVENISKDVATKAYEGGGGGSTAGACLFVKFPNAYSGNFSASLLDGTKLPIFDLPNNYDNDSYYHHYTDKLVYGIPLDLENGVEVIINYIPDVGVNQVEINGFHFTVDGPVIDRENNTITLSNRAEEDGNIYPLAVRGWSELIISDFNPK